MTGQRYWKLKAEWLCPICGKRHPKPGKTLCEECCARRREKRLEREKRLGQDKIRKERHEAYRWYVDNHICPVCKKRRAAPGVVHCEECLERFAERRKPSTPIQRERDRIRHRKLVEERKAACVCTRCGKHKPLPGKVMCLECTLKARRKNTKQRRKRGVLPRESDGRTCYFCGAPVVPGKKVCAKHYAWLLESAAHMRTRQENGTNWGYRGGYAYERDKTERKKGIK